MVTTDLIYERECKLPSVSFILLCHDLISYSTCSLWLVWNNQCSDQYSKLFSLIKNVIFLGYVLIIVKGHFCSLSLSFPIAILSVIFCTVCLVFIPVNCVCACKHMHICTLSHAHTHFSTLDHVGLFFIIQSSPVLFLKLLSIFQFSLHDGAKLLLSWYLQSSSKSLFELSPSFPQFLFCLDCHILRNLVSLVCFQCNSSWFHDHISSLFFSMLDNNRHNIVQTIHIFVMVLENNWLCFRMWRMLVWRSTEPVYFLALS
jgi:hypothetical protein